MFERVEVQYCPNCQTATDHDVTIYERSDRSANCRQCSADLPWGMEDDDWDEEDEVQVDPTPTA